MGFRVKGLRVGTLKQEDEKKKVKTLQGRDPQDDGPVEMVVMSDGVLSGFYACRSEFLHEL